MYTSPYTAIKTLKNTHNYDNHYSWKFPVEEKDSNVHNVLQKWKNVRRWRHGTHVKKTRIDICKSVQNVGYVRTVLMPFFISVYNFTGRFLFVLDVVTYCCFVYCAQQSGILILWSRWQTAVMWYDIRLSLRYLICPPFPEFSFFKSFNFFS